VDRVLTIGVYGWTPESWLAALRAAGCDEVLDVRARRGVRGSEYAFANRRRLEAILADSGIRYRHLPELAPSAEIRAAQVATDKKDLTRKRDRAALSSDFVERYEAEVGGPTDWVTLADRITSRAPALLCVERTSRACHRSIAADRIAATAGVPLEHLEP
jgi:uncharacterized protein (DUF488 family)